VQFGQQGIGVDAIFCAGVVDGMKRADHATDAKHFVRDEHRHRLGPAAHDVSQRQIGIVQ